MFVNPRAELSRLFRPVDNSGKLLPTIKTEARFSSPIPPNRFLHKFNECIEGGSKFAGDVTHQTVRFQPSEKPVVRPGGLDL